MTVVRWTLKRKLLTLVVGTLLPLLLLIGFWAWWEVREHTEAAARELTLASAQAASLTRALLDGVLSHLDDLARKPTVQHQQAEGMRQLFRDLVAEHRELENVLLANADGQVVAAAIGPTPGVSVSLADRAWFQQAMATGRAVTSGFLIGRISGEPVVVVATPVRGNGGGPTGVLAARLSLEKLHLQFRALPLTGGRALALVDEAGYVLARAPEVAGSIGGRLPSAGALPLARGAVHDLAWLDGEKHVAGVAPIPGTGWWAVVSVPEALMRERIRDEITTIALPFLGVVAVSSAIGLLIARQAWTSLRALADAAARLPRGGPVPALRAETTDEVGQLAQTFNAMAAEIAASRAALEQRVAELTALSEAGRLLTGTLELPEVLRRLTELVRTRLAVAVVKIWLRDPTSGELGLAVQAGVTQEGRPSRTRFGPGQGLVGWIMSHREPLVLADVRTDPRLENREWVDAEGLRSFLGVPILLEDAPVGVLAACSVGERRDFSPDDVALAQLFALPAAQAILNARLYDDARASARQLSERNRQLQLLHEAARALTGEHEVERLLQRIVETAAKLVGAGYGALVVHREGRAVQLFATGMTEEERQLIGRLPEGRGLLGHVIEHGQTLRLDDIATHPAAIGLPPGHPPIRTLLATPVRARDDILGAIYLAEKAEGFTADDEDLLGALSADAAVAIEKARLLEGLRRALEDLQATQDQLVQTETLRAAALLASGVAHHMNNVLAVVQGRVQLLLRKVEEPSIRRALELVEQAALRGSAVVRGLHGFSRVHPVSEPVALDLNDLAEQVLDLTAPRWRDESRRRGIPVEVRLEPGELPVVTGDPGALKEVLVSLLSNAVEAIPEGGEVVVRTWARGGEVHCSVTDTGVGMSDEVRQHALEPFFTTKGPQTSGLGLSVGHGILQRHGGRLGIESAPGRGTTVTISLPAARQAPAPPSPEPVAAILTPPRRILVIESEKDVRETLVEILAGHGHVVSQAAGAEEGLSSFRAERHDLVFTAAALPGTTGLEIAEAIKALHPAARVVLVLGWGDEPASPERAAGRVDRVIRKPFDLRVLAGIAEGAPEARTA